MIPRKRRSDALLHQTTLARFGELALRSDDLDVILTEACRLAAEALGTEMAKVVALQDDGRTLQVRAGVGWVQASSDWRSFHRRKTHPKVMRSAPAGR